MARHRPAAVVPVSEDTGSIRIPPTSEAIAERIKVAVRNVRRAEGWIGKLIFFGVVAMVVGLLMVGIAAGLLAGDRDVTMWRSTLNAFGLAVFIAGVATACSGLIMSSARHHIQLARLENAVQQLRLNAQLEGLHADVGRLAAYLESVTLQLAESRKREAAMLEMVRQIRQDIEANEKRREADLLQVTELARKRIEELQDQLDNLATVNEETARRAYAQGLADLLAAVREEAAGRQREGSPPAQSNGSHDVVDPKYLLDMSEAIRLGREMERRELGHPDSPN